jgi:PPK2 family polyphosphate:nucleotide phosphotransferase
MPIHIHLNKDRDAKGKMAGREDGKEPRMKLKPVVKQAREFSRPYRVSDGRRFRLKDFNAGDSGGFESKDKRAAREMLETGVRALSVLQDRLYAQDHWAVLVVFQAIDAAGKDSAIKHVMSGVNPQGCQVTSFKTPSSEELDHDYLWRSMKVLPERGRIGIFNRSYYEELIVVRVHEELLAKQRIPPRLIHRGIWKERAEDITNFERYLAHNGIAVCKFFLFVSRKEQRKRLLERLDKPSKHWKFSIADLKERDCWNDYMDAYEDAIRRTATSHAPWYVVPADHKWFTQLVVAAAIIDTLDSLRLRYPEIDDAQRRDLAKARKILMAE